MIQYYVLPGRRVAHAIIRGTLPPDLDGIGYKACHHWPGRFDAVAAPASMPRCKKCLRIVKRLEAEQ